MHQSLENVREACTKQGRDVTATTGMRTKEMRAWRSLGRAMLDIHMLVFNLGRSDFRGRHLRACAIEVQSSLSTSPPESAVAMGHAMLLAVGSLVEMRGILQFIQTLCHGYELVNKNGKLVISNARKLSDPRSVVPMKGTLRTTCKPLLVHRCWRQFPSLTLKITEIVLGGSFNGVSLQKETFQDPLARGTPAPANGRRQDDQAAQRNERFHNVFVAIGRLLACIKT